MFQLLMVYVSRSQYSSLVCLLAAAGAVVFSVRLVPWQYGPVQLRRLRHGSDPLRGATRLSADRDVTGGGDEQVRTERAHA